MANYVNGREMHDELVLYHTAYQQYLKDGLNQPKISDKLGSAFMQIATRMMSRPNFSGYTYKDEMIADAVLQCFTKIHTYDPSRANIDSPTGFGWSSQICWNAAIGRIKKEQHQCSIKARLIRDKLSSEFVQHGVDSAIGDGDNSFVEFLKDVDAYVDYNEIREENSKTQKQSTLTHRNRTQYKKKEEQEVAQEIDLQEFFE